MQKLMLLFTALCLFYSCKKDNADPSGELIYREDFNDNESTGFWTGIKTSDSLKAFLKDGKYQILNQRKEDGKWQSFTINPVFIVDTGDVALETSLAVTPLYGESQAYAGMAWGVDHNTHQIFVFGFFADGYFDIWGFPHGASAKQYVAVRPEAAIKKDGSNILRIEKKEHTLRFLINGEEVFEMNTDIETLDRTGVVTDSHTKAQFDYFKAENLPL